jgi:hypothetical protein
MMTARITGEVGTNIRMVRCGQIYLASEINSEGKIDTEINRKIQNSSIEQFQITKEIGNKSQNSTEQQFVVN